MRKSAKIRGGLTRQRTGHTSGTLEGMSHGAFASSQPALRATVARRLERARAQLSAAATGEMERKLPWYAALPADARSWVGLVAHAGITAFVTWFREPDDARTVTADVFGTAPRELARTIKLQQTVELVRATIDVVESYAEGLADPAERDLLHDAMLQYSREVAFAAAEVYAQAAESRGAWDARLESLIVDAVVRGDDDEALRSRAAALGWAPHPQVAVVVGPAPPGEPEHAVDQLRRDARHHGVDVLIGAHGDRLVAVLGGPDDLSAAIAAMTERFGTGPVVVGPVVDDLTEASRSALAAVSGLHAVVAWPGAPRPVSADDLLPERALAGDMAARRRLVDDVYVSLTTSGAAIMATVTTYLEQAPSMEAAARALFVHPNTVRYRLRRVADITGYAPTEPRGAHTLRIALALGRLDAAAAPSVPVTG